MATTYANIVFLQDDDYDEFESILYPDREPGYLPFPSGHEAALEYLAQWDYGDSEILDEPQFGNADDEYSSSDYVMSWNASLGYAGLVRKITDKEN